MKIEKNKEYKIIGHSEYFKKKYGTSNPTIIIEGEHKRIFGGWWGMKEGNPACLLYAMRSASEDLPTDSPNDDVVYYGKIGILGELVHINELKEMK